LKLRKLKHTTEERLTSEKGIAYRKRRPAEDEPVFGNSKHKKHFKRFMLRGLEKVDIETGLLAITHNLEHTAAYCRGKISFSSQKRYPNKKHRTAGGQK